MPRKKSVKRKSSFKRKIFFFLLISLIGTITGVYNYPAQSRKYFQSGLAFVIRKVQQFSRSSSSGYTGHTDPGIPGKADTIIKRPGYALGYIEKHEQPAWVMYRLTGEQVTTKAARRTNKFKADPDIPTGSATPEDYRNSGFDRGHLAPAADMAYSARTMADSFYMSNMSPQDPQFNRGIWKELEAQVRTFAVAEKEIYVVTGPILPEEKVISIGVSKVTVPYSYYKVIYDSLEEQTTTQ